VRTTQDGAAAVEPLSQHVAHTVETVASVRTKVQGQITRQQRAIDVFTSALGRPRTLYIIVGIVGAWCAANALMARPLDAPPFFWLQGGMGLSAMLMATVILITQNRQTREAEQRSQLELQVNLLIEKKVAKLIDLMEELRRDLPNVQNRVDRTAEAMTETVDAVAVLSVLEQTIDDPSDRKDKGPGVGTEPPEG
jgi:uncharacterized membrane protein